MSENQTELEGAMPPLAGGEPPPTKPKRKAAAKKAQAKKAAKKAPAKKAAAKKPKEPKKPKKPPLMAGSFDILSDVGAGVHTDVAAALERLSATRKLKPTNFTTLAQMHQEIVPVDDFYLQYLLDGPGYPLGRVIQIIGDTRLGKSTLGHYFLGCAMRHLRCPVLAVHWALKPFMADRALRTMSSVPTEAEAMVERVAQASVSSLVEMEQHMMDWVKMWRERLAPEKPLVVLLDNASKYLASSEMAGFTTYDGNMTDAKKKKFKETGGGSTMVAAVYWQAFTRRLGDWMPKNNVTLIHIVDQNDDTSGESSGFNLPEKWTTLRNDTARGGRGVKQVSALRLILGMDSPRKLGTEQTGNFINIRNDKSSYGVDDRVIKAELRNQHARYDTPDYLDPAWNYAESMCKWFATEGFFGTTVYQNRYTCPALGLESAPAETLSAMFHQRPDLMQALGEQLGMKGYDRTVDRVIEAVEGSEPNE